MYAKINRGLSSLSSLGLLVLRMGIGGIYFLLHGLHKMEAGRPLWDKLGSSVTLVGIHFAPVFWGFLASSSECVGGLLLVLGLFTRPAAFFLFCTMTVAWLHLHGTPGRALETTTEPLEMAFVFLGLIFVGPGKYSVDAKLGAE
jgi:putative oxidoreductase